MNEPYYWYVLYVRTGAENRVADDLKRYVSSRALGCDIDPFCPESEYYYRNKKDRQLGRTYKKRPLFPSYVFVETSMPPKEFMREFGSYFYASHDVIRLLRSGESDSGVALPIDERRRLEFLLKGKRCLERSVGYIVGDRVCVQDGPLKDSEGLIKYINRHNRFADIEVDMFGGKVKARVALEIVEKTE